MKQRNERKTCNAWRTWDSRLAVYAVFMLVLCMSMAAGAARTDTLAAAGETQTEYEDLYTTDRWEAADRSASSSGTSDSLLSTQESGKSFRYCYGDQLTGLGLELYRALASYYAGSSHAGNFTYTFKSPLKFSYKGSADKWENTSGYKKLIKTLKTAGQNAIDAFTFDYPEVFWAGGWSYMPDGLQMDSSKAPKRTVICRKITFQPSVIGKLSSKAARAAFSSSVRTAVKEIKSRNGAGNSTYQLVRIIHDYLCDELTYSEADGMLAHSAGAAFVGNNRAVCEGYAKAFKVLCDEMEVPCVLVPGQAGNIYGFRESHMWNYVRMGNNNWYLVDVTWDDLDRTGAADDTYYLAGSSTIGLYGISVSTEREPDGDFNGAGYMTFSFPELSSGTYQFPCGDGHTIVTDSAIEATCTSTGKTEGSHCSVCGDVITKQETVPKAEHTIVSVSAKAATCTTEGYTAGKMCSVCGSFLSGHKKIKALGHKWGKWIIVTPATFSSKGLKMRICARDHEHTLTRSIAKEKWTIKKKPAGVKVKRKKGSVTVSWKKLKAKDVKIQKKIASVQIQYSTDSSFKGAKTRKVSKKKTKATIKLPEKGTVYYIRVRYAGSGGVSKWSSVKKIRAK